MEKRAKGRTLMSYAPDIKVVDCTLRDGGLVNDFYFTDEFVKGRTSRRAWIIWSSVIRLPKRCST